MSEMTDGLGERTVKAGGGDGQVKGGGLEAQRARAGRAHRKAKAKAKMGRPMLKLDPKTVGMLARLGATNVEIGEALGCSEATVRARFCEILTKARATRKIRLRQWQWASAERGNIAMQIFLGKQELGQKDEHALKHIGGIPVKPEWEGKSADEIRKELESRGVKLDS